MEGYERDMGLTEVQGVSEGQGGDRGVGVEG